jgi:hypothetical protein
MLKYFSLVEEKALFVRQNGLEFFPKKKILILSQLILEGGKNP